MLTQGAPSAQTIFKLMHPAEMPHTVCFLQQRWHHLQRYRQELLQPASSQQQSAQLLRASYIAWLYILSLTQEVSTELSAGPESDKLRCGWQRRTCMIVYTCFFTDLTKFAALLVMYFLQAVHSLPGLVVPSVPSCCLPCCTRCTRTVKISVSTLSPCVSSSTCINQIALLRLSDTIEDGNQNVITMQLEQLTSCYTDYQQLWTWIETETKNMFKPQERPLC